LVVIEINPGYREVVAHAAVVSSLLANDKVDLVVGDGRQWLKAHPSERFDAIVMNTTFSWRNNASNVLSQEFLRLVAAHLAPGGVALVNPTGSSDVIATALSVFPFALDVGGTLFLGESPLAFDRERWRGLLARYRLDGRPVFDLSDPAQRKALDEIVAGLPVQDRDAIARRAGNRPITDDNMGVEWPRVLTGRSGPVPR
jgi:SAM-dependent methyltransferase